MQDLIEKNNKANKYMYNSNSDKINKKSARNIKI